MPFAYRLFFQDASSGGREELQGEFPEEEWGVLADFRTFAADLESAELLKPGKRDVGGFQWTAGVGMRSTSTTPLLHIRELLHLLRPFLLEGERTYLLKATGIIGRRIPHVEVRRLLGSLNDDFNGKRAQRFFAFTSNQVVLNSEPVLKAWLNGYEYHRDIDKRAFIESLHGVALPLEVTKGLLTDMLIDKAIAVLNVAGIIHQIEHSQDTVEEPRGLDGSPGDH